MSSKLKGRKKETAEPGKPWIWKDTRTKFERSSLISAAFWTEKLVDAALHLKDYMAGIGGRPDAANSAFTAADNVRYYLNSALSVRLARFETRAKKSKERKQIVRDYFTKRR